MFKNFLKIYKMKMIRFVIIMLKLLLAILLSALQKNIKLRINEMKPVD